MQSENRRSEDHWHLDKRVPISIIVAILIQTFTIGWYMSDMSARIIQLEKDRDKAEIAINEMREMKIHLQYMNKSIEDLTKFLKEDVEWSRGGKKQ